jgi:phosphatidylglycerophosphate synthase
MTVTQRSAAGRTWRDRARAAVEPVARVFGRLGLTPNALTLIGFGIAVVAAVAIAAQLWLVGGLLVAFGAVFDLFDGALARVTNTTSRLGAFLDSVFDRAGEAVVYVGIAVGCVMADLAWAAILAMGAMAAAFMVSYTRAKSESLGFTSGSGMARVGFAPREVRMVILVVGLVLIGLSGGIQMDYEARWWRLLLGEPWLVLSLGLITVLATFTTIQRIVHVVLQSRKQET